MLKITITVLAMVGVLVLLLSGCTNEGDSPTPPETTTGETRGAPRGTLTKAVLRNDLPAVENALKAGADINERVGEGEDQFTPLLAAVVMGNEFIAQTLVENGAAIYPTYQGYNAKDFAYQLYPESSRLIFLLERASAHGQ